MNSNEDSLTGVMPIELAREIARQGEVKLVAIINLGTAADLRATALCGIFGAAAVGIGAAVLAALASDHPLDNLIAAGAFVSVGLFVAAVIAGIAGAPRDFFVAGGDPDSLREWSWHGRGWYSEAEMLDATGARYAKSIENNKRTLESGACRIKAALIVALASSAFGVAINFLPG